uniref:Host cell factor 1 n=2 Tax=Cacopsylla melanoneura TaxID=428564 RepID=A0A8D8R5S3_9HEMI
MEEETNTVDRSGLKRKLDDTESPSEHEQPVVQPPSSVVSDSIDLNMPVVDSVLESGTPTAHKMEGMELQDSDLMAQDIPVTMSDTVDLPLTLGSDLPAVGEVPTEPQLPGLDETEQSEPSSGDVLVQGAEQPQTTQPSVVPPSTEDTPVDTPEEPVVLPLASLPGLDLPSLDASLPITTAAPPPLEIPVTTPTTEPAPIKEEPLPTETNITIKHEEVDIKHELPLSVGPSDEALISECEKLLEENREFEKSQMDDDDNDDQHSSDTVSVDSDTAKRQEDDFKDEPMDVDATPKVEQSPIKQEDPLSTLASAALGIKNSSVMKQEPKDIKKKTLTPWCDVGIFNNPSCVVTGFYANQDTNEYINVNSNILPSLDDLPKLSLEPGTAYKFRVCAVNSCGRGPWSEVSAFRTCLPGFPGAPSSIKISKSPDGANISWHPPASPSGNIIEYSVCLAIKKYNHRNEEIKPNPAALTFEKVYSGASNHAVVSHAALASAYVDTTNKPAIIFRIAAKNEKGYGPATQVRWLQDVYVPKK